MMKKNGTGPNTRPPRRAPRFIPMDREMLCNTVLAFEGKVTGLREALQFHGYADSDEEKTNGVGILEILGILEMLLPHLHSRCGVSDRVNLPFQ